MGTLLTMYPAEGFHLTAGLGMSPALFGRKDTLSALGRPKMYSDYQAGFGFDFGEAPRWSVDVGWRADVVAMQNTRRTFHLATSGLTFSY